MTPLAELHAAAVRTVEKRMAKNHYAYEVFNDAHRFLMETIEDCRKGLAFEDYAALRAMQCAYLATHYEIDKAKIPPTPNPWTGART